MSKPTILVTNDDGIYAPGLRALIDMMREFGRVIVVAPNKPHSGKSHAITIDSPLRLFKQREEEDYVEYATNGTPVDCVKLGEKVALDEKPDLLVSGINHGSNATVNVVYSGTMAAVIEGCMSRISSIGFSLDDYSQDADFESSRKYIRDIVRNTLENPLPEGNCLNVNIPAVPFNQIKGVRVCRQGLGYWDERFDHRVDPRKREYFWLTGEYVSIDGFEDTDEWALKNNYVAVVPMQFDWTSHEMIDKLKALNQDV
ncbi:MAG: 5'/3'-nucleotidase SurE [Bacteroidales bacterium]|nr:5'/3'-nucleotidase SurE [Bacteroidales bacterium]